MGKIAVLLRDVAPDKKGPGSGGARQMLTPEQWTEILEADARGVSSKTIFAKLSGVVTPFFGAPKTFANALASERAARRKAKEKPDAV